MSVAFSTRKGIVFETKQQPRQNGYLGRFLVVDKATPDWSRDNRGDESLWRLVDVNKSNK